jgi:hypothetical protein
VDIIGQKAEVSGEQKLILSFAGRACGNAKKTGKIPVSVAPTSFGNIGSY